MPPCPAAVSSMDCSPEPAYLNLPGWRCVPVYAVPLSPTLPNHEPHKLLPSNIPTDPRQWSRQNVFAWLEWCVENFSLQPFEADKFFMNGRGLCLLKKSDFCERVPRCGDVLYNALQLLLRRDTNKQPQSSSGNCNGGSHPGISASLLQHAAQDKTSFMSPSRFGWPRSISSDYHSMGHVVREGEANSDADSTTAGSPPHLNSEDTPTEDPVTLKSSQPLTTTPITRQLSQFNDNVVENTTEKINVRLLWDFLQQLLNDSQQRYHGCIIWKDKGRGIFKITDPHRLAALWGKQKNHLNMNFDKMSRALRYYYRVRILQKEPGERHCYRFLRHPSELRHCKQRALLARDPENISHNGIQECADIEAALDMSIKEEGSSPGDVE